MPQIDVHELDAFVARIDALGGPGDPRVDAYWSDLVYRPTLRVDTSLDPLGPDYLRAQLALYGEISGRDLDQSVNEHTVFDKARHLRARNPYAHGEPKALAGQMLQLISALRLAAPRHGARLLDMGCGWGLSSELASYLGLQVHAVDINPDFVDLVRARSARYGYGITATRAGFDDFVSPTPYDVVLFYECLHHAVEPWSVLRRLAGMLAPGGAIVACGEPINAHWWPHWGLRLDPLSIYCIRKHGWFESGWSLDFIVRCLDQAGLNTTVHHDPDPTIGAVLIARKDAKLAPAWMSRNCEIDGAVLDGDYLVAGAATRLAFDAPIRPAALILHSFRPAPVRARWRLDDGRAAKFVVQPGETRLDVPDWRPGRVLSLESETWSPADEIGNLDTRRLAFQIAGIELALEA